MNVRTRIPRLAQALLLAFVFVCGLFPMTDTDVWWHLSAGRWMWERFAIPRVDPFTVSAYGRPWLDAQWGFQGLLYPLWNLGGGFALVAAKSLAFAAVFALVFARGWTRKTAPFLFALGIFAAFHARHLADVRPVWATLLLLAWQYRLLRDHLDGRRRLPWIALILSQLVMVQMQGLYWLGPAQFAVLWVGAGTPRRKPLLLLGGALALASLVNPYGWRAWGFPLELFTRVLPVPGNLFSREVAENLPLWIWLPENPGAALPVLWLAVMGGILLAAARARETRGEAGLLLMYGVLGAMAQRNLIFLLLGFLVVAARTLPLLVAEARTSGLRFRVAAAFALAWSVASLAGYALDLRASWRWENLPWAKSGSWETPLRFPRGAAAYLQAHSLRGAVFNEMRHGGYLGWRLWPAHRPFIDGRMILHDADFMREFLDLFDHPDRFESYRNRYDINIVVLPIGEDDRYRGLAASLARDSAWSVLYCDGAEVLLARSEAWRGRAAPEAWSPRAGEAAARARFGANPMLLGHARRRLAAFLEQAALDSAGPASPHPAVSRSASLLEQVRLEEQATFIAFPALSAPSVSLADSLEKYRRRLAASGFPGFSDSARAAVLARFLFDTLRLRAVDESGDLALSLPSRVLQDRRGSCTGLALLLLMLAEKTGVEARPVFLPGHLFVRLASGGGWRNVELLRGGIARPDSFYAAFFRLRQRPWYRLRSTEPSRALAALFFNRGNAYRDAARPREALSEYLRAERVLPGFPEALGSAGALLWSRGDAREGRQKLEESLANDPLSDPARATYEWHLKRESNR